MRDPVPFVDEFPVDALVYMIFAAAGEKPIVALVGRGARALADDIPQLSSILEKLGLREPLWMTCSHHVEGLLLHTPEESDENINKFYKMAGVVALDCWDVATETTPLERTIEPVVRGWFARRLGLGKRLPPIPRELHPVPGKYMAARFPKDAAPITAIGYARALTAFGLYAKSCLVLQQLLEKESENGAAHFQLGHQLAKFLKKPDAGIAHLRKATELAPDKAEAWNILGFALASAGQDVEACEAYTREAALMDDFVAWMNVAQQSLINGLTGNAREAAKRARRHDPLDSHPLLLLAVCARRENNNQEADRLFAEQKRLRMPMLPPEILEPLVQEASGKK